MKRQPDTTVTDLVKDLPSLLTRQEAAKFLRKNPRSIDRWITLGQLKAVRPGGGFPLIPRAEIERLLSEADDASASASAGEATPWEPRSSVKG